MAVVHGPWTAREGSSVSGKIAFVLAASDHGSMIVNRLDYRADGKGYACGVGIMVLEQGSHEAGEIATVLDLVCAREPAQPVIVDVGANIGTHTIAWARALADVGGEVIAIEPQERIYYALAGNIALNNCFNARAVWAAACDHSGTLRIPRLDHRRPANFGGLSLKPGVAQDPGQPVDFAEDAMVEVPALRIDDLGLPRLDMLKIDVEGMEPEVLAGAQGIIARMRPIVFAERAICGDAAIAAALPGYRLVPAGMSVLAMHADDPMWNKIKVSA